MDEGTSGSGFTVQGHIYNPLDYETRPILSIEKIKREKCGYTQYFITFAPKLCTHISS